jgi:hypothetical protein
MFETPGEPAEMIGNDYEPGDERELAGDAHVVADDGSETGTYTIDKEEHDLDEDDDGGENNVHEGGEEICYEDDSEASNVEEHQVWDNFGEQPSPAHARAVPVSKSFEIATRSSCLSTR